MRCNSICIKHVSTKDIMFNSLQLGISSVAFITDIVRLIYCLLNKEKIITFDDKKNTRGITVLFALLRVLPGKIQDKVCA